MKQAHVFISGFVQGVGYRHFVRKKALELNLRGWVRNLTASPSGGLGGPDNRVEAIFQGEKTQIEKMIKECKKGPFLSEVEDVQVFWEEEKEHFSDFVIKP